MAEHERDGWIWSEAPAGWSQVSTTTLASPDRVVQMTAHCHRIDPATTLDAFADAHEPTALGSISVSASSEASVVPLVAGLPTRTRIATWGPPERDVTTLLAYAVAGGWGVRCHASAPSTVFGERLGDVVAVLASISFPAAPARKTT